MFASEKTPNKCYDLRFVKAPKPVHLALNGKPSAHLTMDDVQIFGALAVTTLAANPEDAMRIKVEGLEKRGFGRSRINGQVVLEKTIVAQCPVLLLFRSTH